MKKILLSILLATATLAATAQDDLGSMLDSEEKPTKEYVTATFKGTRLINSHTIETVGKRTLEFRIAHRFGEFNSGIYDFFGFDGGASIRMSFDYSYDGRLMFGVGRNSVNKLYDGYIKYKLLRQTTTKGMPVSVTLVTNANITAMRDANSAANGYNRYSHFSSRMSYMTEIIIGRKINKTLSLQVAPMFIHFNQVERITDKNDVYAIAAAGRVKLSNRMALTGEYIYRLNKYSKSFSSFYNSASVGIDVETGGHVFQMHVTNSLGINETQFVPYTSTSWKNLGIRLGFNISRVFRV